ncbi:SMI1/KNR4 family protein [Tundrisphaera sp. TA3]|uniref:SMI1/KNR4 family protein n=1 Tax=Tundrisphaera sp. TA3 TaxID=3435775 RepID=UPI003EBDC704
MDIDDEVIRLAGIVPREPGTSLPHGARYGQIAAFSLLHGVEIPPEVESWLLFTDGPRIGFGGVYGLRDFKETYEIHPGFKERNWLPLGTDGCGDYYVLALDSIDKPLRPVYFIDPYASGYDTPTYAVASGFWQFLRFMFRHELGERGWPFDRAYVLAADPEFAGVRSAPLPWVANERP